MNAPRCDQTDAWATLKNHFKTHGCNFDLCKAFELDRCRFEDLAIEAPEVFADLSKNGIDRSTLRHVIALALNVAWKTDGTGCSLATWSTSQRGAPSCMWHCVRRRGRGMFSDEVYEVLDAMLAYAEQMRDIFPNQHPLRDFPPIHLLTIEIK